MVTFSGINFSADPTTYSIVIDEQPCAVNAATSTSVTCTTAKRPGLYATTTLDMTIAGMGSIAT